MFGEEIKKQFKNITVMDVIFLLIVLNLQNKKKFIESYLKTVLKKK